jgi:hypothetical protein
MIPFGFVAPIIALLVRVALCGLTEDAREYQYGDDRDYGQDDQGYDGNAHGLYPFIARISPPDLTRRPSY